MLLTRKRCRSESEHVLHAVESRRTPQQPGGRGDGSAREHHPILCPVRELQALTVRGQHRRMLTDDHPKTAESYENLAVILKDQGKFADAQTLYVKALAINRRLLTDNHPLTARNYGRIPKIGSCGSTLRLFLR